MDDRIVSGGTAAVQMPARHRAPNTRDAQTTAPVHLDCSGAER